MKPTTAELALTGIPQELLEEFRPQIEAALRSLPLTLLSLTSRQGVTHVEVEYDGSDSDLNDQLLERVIDTVSGAIPEDRLEDAFSFEDPELGLFVRDSHWWEGECEVAGSDEPLSVRLVTDEEAVPGNDVLERARQVVRNFAACEQRWRKIAVRELFDICNNNWRPQSPVAIEEFLATLSISSISVVANGWTNAYYFAGDLFLEHDIEISIGPNGEEQAGLIGG